MNRDDIRTIVDELIRMGLVKEIWFDGEDEPRYVTVEKNGVD